jgi:hypothetical protein
MVSSNDKMQCEEGVTYGTLGFVDPDQLPPENEKPYIIVFPVSHIPGAKQHNFEFHTKSEIPIRDLRGQEARFKLDTHGFEVMRWNFNPSWVVDEDVVQQIYCRKAEQFLQHALGAREVVVFDWLVYSPQCAEKERVLTFCKVRKNTSILKDRRFRKQLRPAQNVHIGLSLIYQQGRGTDLAP